MKKSTIILTALICMMMQSVSVFAQDMCITNNELPSAIKTFVKQNFPNQVIDYVYIDTDLDDSAYEICLNNGIEIDFDLNGDWKMVDCNEMNVPSNILPITIERYVDTHFGGATVVKIEKEHNGYEVELSNGIEMKFNYDGELLYIED